jgi:ubiquinone/menaquinone biosynthesis C-methylase UbiE
MTTLVQQAKIQADYYARSAAVYDALHLGGDDEHSLALRYVSALVREFEINSVLDVGTGTGRAIATLQAARPAAVIVGIEPVMALLSRARAKPGVHVTRLASASGYSLPFADASFDGVCQFGVLHHVSNPNDVVREMLRVARRAVFVSDSNRFGQGRFGLRVAKLALAATGLWPAANLLKTRGNRYSLSAGDGLSYSYSVFDSLSILQAWADRVVLVPTGLRGGPTWSGPLLTASHVLVCAIRDR